ncbi:MAG: 3-hydroxyacyl-CoA dehydrogenase/enoyl-CoA hydratase family protein [Rhodocyclaceae bacterium]|nr:3-hydroxyacyl-CoA dehydrogenase/enoyl-CoA hydratase family protein [Rhodocyclaceae bacterium]
MSRFFIRKVAVLGAGVMGAQIAAHLANAGVPVLLFDLAPSEGDGNGVVRKALDGLKKLKPAPFGEKSLSAYVDAANYDQHLERLADCDLVIEAIAEKMEWKEALYQKIAPHLKADAIIASNTSGLSIQHLAGVMPEVHRSRFCGVHFFNPPRYMNLVEIIPCAESSVATLDDLETWLTSTLGKGVIRALDTPNFVANRVGCAWLLMVAHHTRRLGLGFDEVDALTGTRIGLPKSATYRLLDIVGLDTLGHVIGNMQANLGPPSPPRPSPEGGEGSVESRSGGFDGVDPWHDCYGVPAWIKGLIESGALGQKAGRGIYRREGKTTRVFDLTLNDYRDSTGSIAPEVEALLKLKGIERLRQLRASPHPQAQLLWAIQRDIFHYCAVHLGAIAESARDMDLCMRWGYGWSRGPFEIWQEAGWQEVAALISEDIEAGKTLAATPLPSWVFEVDGVHGEAGSWSASQGKPLGRSSLPVYRRQLYPELLLGESTVAGRTVWENEGVRLWVRDDVDAGIALLSFKTRMHAIGADVVAGVMEAVARAENAFDGLVIWQEPPFAVGANLKEVAEAVAAGRFEELDGFIQEFQRASLALKYARVPTIAAVQGMALGGGCEFALYASERVAAFESNFGLVEAGVGLIPAGGGCAFLAKRASDLAAAMATGDVFAFLESSFMNVAQARVSGSALEARAMGYLRGSDTVVMNTREVLFVAMRKARALADMGYRPPLAPRAIHAAGRTGIATCEMTLANMRAGGFISDYDWKVARAAAVALCGGEIDAGTLVTEQWILDVERREFLALLKTPETQARIRHMLETGKPLRN